MKRTTPPSSSGPAALPPDASPESPSNQPFLDRWEPRRHELPSERVLGRAATLAELRENAVLRYMLLSRRPGGFGGNGGTAKAQDAPARSWPIRLLQGASPLLVLLVLFNTNNAVSDLIALLGALFLGWELTLGRGKRSGGGILAPASGVGVVIYPGLPRAVALDLILTPISGRDLALAHWARAVSLGSRRFHALLMAGSGLAAVWFAVKERQPAIFILGAGAAGACWLALRSGGLQLTSTRAAAKTALKREQIRGRALPMIGRFFALTGLGALLLIAIGLIVAAVSWVIVQAMTVEASNIFWAIIGAGFALCVGALVDLHARKNFDANLAAASRDFDALLDAIRVNGPMK